MSKSLQGCNPHIVISTKELQDPEILVDFLSSDKRVLTYIVVVEHGTNGHPHIEAFASCSRPVRQDTLKSKIVELYKLDDYLSKLNTKITFNHIDPDPMYGYGYAMKESPKVKYTNLDEDYLLRSLQYYKDHEEQVNLLKQELKKTYKRFTVDDVSLAYLDYIRVVCKDNIPSPLYFDNFMRQYSEFIPFSMYQKINREKMNEWVCNYKDRVHSLDCTPPPYHTSPQVSSKK